MQQKYKYVFHTWTLILTFVNFSTLNNYFYSAKVVLLSTEICLNYTKSTKFTASIVQPYSVFVNYTKTFTITSASILYRPILVRAE